MSKLDARVAKFEATKASRSQDGATLKKQALERSAEKCPILFTHHYFTANWEDTMGQELTSAHF